LTSCQGDAGKIEEEVLRLRELEEDSSWAHMTQANNIFRILFRTWPLWGINLGGEFGAAICFKKWWLENEDWMGSEKWRV